MGKGSKTSTSSMPDWYEDAAQAQAAQAQMVGQMPYMPWMGPDVAGANPQLQNAWNQSNMWSDAMGMGGGGGGNMQMPQQGLYNMGQQQNVFQPPPMQQQNLYGQQQGQGQLAPGAQPVPGANPNFGGGHSSWGGFNQQLQNLEQYYPGIMEAYQAATPGSATGIAMGPDGRPIPGGGPTAPPAAPPAAEQGGGMGAEDQLDMMRFMQMGGMSGENIDPVTGPSNSQYTREFDRLKEKFSGEDYADMNFYRPGG